MAYKHGIYVSEQETSMTLPISGTAGLVVAIGTAPVHLVEKPGEAVNRPILANTRAEATAALGYSEDWDSYTLCEVMDAMFSAVNTAPVVLINVLNPDKHVSALEQNTIVLTDGSGQITEAGALADTLEVKQEEETLTAGVDYIALTNSDGTISIAVLPEGKASGAVSLTVSGKKVDPSKVTVEDIIGGLDASGGVETGIEAVRQVYPRFGMTPGILIAPRFSREAAVCAALQAKTGALNGVFRCCCMADIDSTATGARRYSDVKAQKEKQGLSAANAYAVWGYGVVGGKTYSGSTLAAALTARTDADNDDIPANSSNRGLGNMTAMHLADGTEVLLDQEQANEVNGGGVGTWLNMNGFRLWGNRTCAWPANTDAKDSFLACRRYMNWRANSFILTYFEKVDSPLNKRLIEAIVDSENVRGNGYVAMGCAARDEISYLEEENSTADLMNGKITFHQYITPYTPAEQIEDLIEFDPEALAGALN